MKVVLDTSFIVTCMKQKVDFFSVAEEVLDIDIEWVVPKQVIKEIESISERKTKSVRDRNAAKTALSYLAKNEFESVDLVNKVVDMGIIEYARLHDAMIATLDKGIKDNYRGDILVIRDKKMLGIVKTY